MFTAPAYFMTAVCVFTIVLLMLYFKDRQRMTTVKDKKKMTAKQSAIAEVALSNVCFGFINTYEACILGCMLLNVSTKGSIGCFEALGVSFADRYVGMGSSTVGTIVACCGAIGVVALLCMGHLSTIMTDVQMICGGMIVMCFGTVSLASMEEDPDKASSWRYILSIFTVYSIGYPIGHTAVVAIFSKIVGRRPQGVLQGYFASAGSLARIIFPVMSGYIANYRDDSAVFWLLTLILAISTIFTLNCQHTLDVLSK
jgi:MFS transporter, ceroid-lipofuscinosis neuronal protein 7